MRCEAKKKRKRPRSGEMRNRAEKKTLEASTEGGMESKSAGINGAIKWIAGV
jgi:hypothetical protein